MKCLSIVALTGGFSAVHGAKIGRSPAVALQDQELLFQDDILTKNGSGSACSQENGQSGQ